MIGDFWLEPLEETWRDGEILVKADVVREGTSIKVGAVKVYFRAEVDITAAFDERELELVRKRVADMFALAEQESGSDREVPA